MKKPVLLISFLMLGLSACVNAPTLEERLAGKTGAERTQEAYYACLEETSYPVPGGHTHEYMGHKNRQRAICDAMRDINKTKEQ